ncbi:MAG: 3-deoxy-D-manno-octulosonic acid transferase [Urechidicola sp.]|nr:3-deoxy-D-manno-octulosonic acid transferase [Urechidicola sp.]
MYTLYNILISIVGISLRLIALFNRKISLFVKGRKEVFSKLENEIASDDKVIWIHCASLGEFEQGRPIIEKLEQNYLTYKILLTFFSPSGYEVRKDYKGADVVCYLPIDTKYNAQKFLKLAHPTLAIFVKYEFWPNMLQELKSKNIETLLVSGIFRENQSFFKQYGSWIRKSLKGFSHFFVQDKNSKKLLESIGFSNVSKSGDTRFDRVFEITQQNNGLDFVSEFKQDNLVLVCGSTWKEDEKLIVSYINNLASENEKFIIAPHNINKNAIAELVKRINKKVVLYSDRSSGNLTDAQVLIIDAIGFLTKVYSYAEVAYIGGGFATGLHNILEPATFGVPILIGPKHKKFNEAVELVYLGGAVVVNNQDGLNKHLKELFTNSKARQSKGKIAGDYIAKNVGATESILEYIDKKITI